MAADFVFHILSVCGLIYMFIYGISLILQLKNKKTPRFCGLQMPVWMFFSVSSQVFCFFIFLLYADFNVVFNEGILRAWVNICADQSPVSAWSWLMPL